MNRRFHPDRWPTKELEERLKRLESMALDGVIQKSFKDQTIIFGNKNQLNNQINELINELNARKGTSGSGTKQVRITTSNRGFRSDRGF